MRPVDELRAWNAVVAAVLERDIANGKASAAPDAPEIPSPLLEACTDVRETLDWIVRTGGHWQGQWVSPERTRRRPQVLAHG